MSANTDITNPGPSDTSSNNNPPASTTPPNNRPNNNSRRNRFNNNRRRSNNHNLASNQSIRKFDGDVPEIGAVLCLANEDVELG